MAKNQELASIISTIKIRCNMKQAEVAEKLGVNKSYLSDTINGRYPYSDELRMRIHEVFGFLQDVQPAFPHSVIHASNSIVTGGGDNSGSVSVGGAAAQGAPAAIAAMRRPIVPRPITRRQNLDVLEYVMQHATQVEASHIIIDDVPVSLWYRVEDEALSPSFVAGDLVALHSAKTGMVGFVPGRVYAVDTRSLGVVLRYVVPDGGGIIARSANPMAFPDFRIEADDVIRIYTVMGMMRMNC